MISFVSLFIGLVMGAQVVEVAVDPRVSRVELRLDGEVLGQLEGPPWSTRLDFGLELLPRELLAEAFDSSGQSLGAVRQWLNLPRAEAEVSLVFEGAVPGSPERARLSWESLVGGRPRSVTATLDGRPLAVTDRRTLELPALDPAELHYLRVEVEFSDTISAVIERVFGGTYTDSVMADLSSLPVLLPEGHPEASLDRLQGWLRKAGQPVEITAVERGPAQILVVRDQGAIHGLERIRREMSGMLRVLGNAHGLETSSAMLREALPLKKDQQLRFLIPHSEAQAGASLSYQLFPSSPQLIDRDGGLYWLLTHSKSRRRPTGPQRLADAVAVAGMSAAGEGRRRVVVLVLGRKPSDASQLAPETVRQYLAALRVPFRVWVLDSKPGEAVARWGESRDISTGGKLDQAAQELMDLLERQVIVWARGTHRPQDLEVPPEAPFALAE